MRTGFSMCSDINDWYTSNVDLTPVLSRILEQHDAGSSFRHKSPDLHSRSVIKVLSQNWGGALTQPRIR